MMPMEDDELRRQAQALHYGEGGSVHALIHWLKLVMEDRDYRSAWPLMDENLRRCRAQAWLWNAGQHYPFIAENRVEYAEDFVQDVPAHQLWDDFAADDLNGIHEAWSEFYARQLGASDRTRPIGLDLELVVMIPTGGTPLQFDEPTVVEALLFIMRHVENRWLVAAWADHLPEPGWPPIR